MKVCASCNTEKPFSEFHKDPRSSRKTDEYRGSCKICVNKKNREWYERNRDQRKISVDRWALENKESIAEKAKVYYLENRGAYAERAKKYRLEDPEKIRLRSSNYYQQNKSAHRALVKAWGERNPDALRAMSHKRRCAERSADGSFTADDVQKLFESQFGICTGCGNALESSGDKKYHVDHIMPIALGGSNWPSNLQLLCPRCNLTKNAKHPDVWSKIKPLAKLKKKK